MDQIILRSVSTPLNGSVTPPPDKSISHRALFFAALNHGRTVLHNVSTAADPLATRNLLESLGYGFAQEEAALVKAAGAAHPHAGHGELSLHCRNSGTTARLACGFLTGERGTFVLIGDDSLSNRPMERVAAPLREMGGTVNTTEGRMPVHVDASHPLSDRVMLMEAASAQVHGALFLAGLRSNSGVLIRRTRLMRDHTIRLAGAFGLETPYTDDNGLPIDEVMAATIDRDVELRIPGDLSSAAFFVVAALIVPDSDITITGVGLNPTRIAFLEALREMGAKVHWHTIGDDAEPVGEIHVQHSGMMRGIDLGERVHVGTVAQMMDELPLLALVGSQVAGTTTVRGAEELRVKESDRIAATARLMRSLGVVITELPDGFEVTGPQEVAGGGAVDHEGDHRLAMVAAVAALIARVPVTIPAPDVVAVSYPEFWTQLEAIAPGAIKGAA
ncbi:MAG TPA: 3-phosphoshikimate 1-carboxyvinyltransferase [Candidatus Kapabacteria bacterium]|nr:3-phosphoshikimate 1-carboxyvinyltransferase [Candidatus Kapabacteria bacterium]